MAVNTERRREEADAMWAHAEQMRNRRILERAHNMWDEAERRRQRRVQWRSYRDRMSDVTRRARKEGTRKKKNSLKRRGKEKRPDLRGHDLRNKLSAQCK